MKRVDDQSSKQFTTNLGKGLSLKEVQKRLPRKLRRLLKMLQ
ncbi:MAG: hypothetical protein WED07_00755 [Candidatus Freyarchaeum deiterrae]